MWPQVRPRPMDTLRPFVLPIPKSCVNLESFILKISLIHFLNVNIISNDVHVIWSDLPGSNLGSPDCPSLTSPRMSKWKRLCQIVVKCMMYPSYKFVAPEILAWSLIDQKNKILSCPSYNSLNPHLIVLLTPSGKISNFKFQKSLVLGQFWISWVLGLVSFGSGQVWVDQKNKILSCTS